MTRAACFTLFRIRKALRVVVPVALALVLGLASVVCASSSQPTVQFVVHSSPERLPLYQAFFDAFQEKSGIQVDFQQAPGPQVQKWEQVITRIAGGVSPDVVGTVSVEFVSYAAAGLIQPLDPWIEKEGADTVVPALLEALQWRGQQYLMPYGASGVTLVFNSQLYGESGLAPPPAEWGDASWTWERFVTDMQKLTQNGGDGVISQFGLAGPYWDSWITLPYNWGGDWVNLETREFLGNRPPALAALQALQELRWVHHVMPQPGEANGGRQGFLSGSVGLSSWGTWDLESLIASNGPFRLAPWFQVGDNPLKGPINPVGLVMLSSSEHKNEAWEFIKFATLDPTGNFLYAQAAGALPSVLGVHQDWVDSMSDRAPDLNPAVFVEQVAAYPAVINIRKTTTFSEINTIMTGAVNAVYNNEKPPAQAMSEVAESVQRLIEQSAH